VRAGGEGRALASSFARTGVLFLLHLMSTGSAHLLWPFTAVFTFFFFYARVPFLSFPFLSFPLLSLPLIPPFVDPLLSCVLCAHARAQAARNGFLAKKDFLDRCDSRAFETERDARLKKATLEGR
jgi:hypothetical protein